MNHGGREAVAHKFLRQPLGAPLGSCEDQRLALFCIKQLPETVEFLSRSHFVGLELYAFGGLEHPAQSEPNRIAHVLTYVGRRRDDSIVAEKHSVCRCLGKTDKMRRIAGKNPISNMRSASSSTSILTCCRSANLRFMRSCRRPGVAITSLAPTRRLWICTFSDRPPTMSAALGILFGRSCSYCS